MTKSYRPTSGSEGLSFTGKFCDHCKREAKYRETDDGDDACPIQTAAMSFESFEPEYPKEWVQDDDAGSNARCTAFQPE